MGSCMNPVDDIIWGTDDDSWGSDHFPVCSANSQSTGRFSLKEADRMSFSRPAVLDISGDDINTKVQNVTESILMVAEVQS